MQKFIRNFSIIAHIDHGKSTLADRLLEATEAVSDRELVDCFLDNLDLERERGITIKAQTARLKYRARDGREYILNLIDTPGHVDFSYEVSRSLAACEGVLLLIDAAQGIEAQTLANALLAMEHDLEIIPVINKIDLPSADPDRVKREIEENLGIDAKGAVLVSAKTGEGVDDVLEAVVQRIPPPSGDPDAPLRALIYDSWYDSYLGVTFLVRMFDGKLKKGDEIQFFSTGRKWEVTKLGAFVPKALELDSLQAGEVGFVAASIKDVGEVKIGDTVTSPRRPAKEPLPGFREMKPVVFCGIFPVQAADYDGLRDALEKLRLNDSSFTFEPETSLALGLGFRCGFLGLLHMEITQERLEREYGAKLITTAPSVVYKAVTTAGETLWIDNPAKLPDPHHLSSLEEPVIRADIFVPDPYIGPVLTLCEERRGEQESIDYIGKNKVQIRYLLPFAEVVFDFYDRLKTVTRGYASLDYQLVGWKEADLVRLDILVNGQRVDALSTILHRDRAQRRGRELVVKLRSLLPRQMFDVPIQAAVGGRIIARETVKALRKNVTAKCYGGDITRKRKLLEKQKEGKKRMKRVGNVEIPQEAFLAVLKADK